MSSEEQIAGAHVVLHRLVRTSKDAKPGRSIPVILLCKRTHDAPIHPSFWGLPGGTRDPSEAPEKTAVREAHEELGMVLDQTRLDPLHEAKLLRLVVQR